MKQTTVEIEGKQAEGFVYPMGPFNLVCLKTDAGMVGCAAFHAAALDGFGYPVATMSGVSEIEDLLDGTVQQVNESARARGITEGMSGREAVARL